MAKIMKAFGKKQRRLEPVVRKAPKYRRLSGDAKQQIFLDIDRGMTITEIAEKHGTSWSNVKKYQHNRESIEQNLSKITPGSTRPVKLKYPQVNVAMSSLVAEMLSKNGNISGRQLRYAAQKYADDNNITGFRSSQGWLNSFSERHDLGFKVLQGEGASVNWEGLLEWFDKTLPPILEKFDLKNIWNCDELGLFYRQLPNKSLVRKSQPTPKGSKLRKDRVTVLLCGSATGERFMPLVVGTAANPRAFVANKVRDGKTERLGFVYKHNKTAWVTRDFFEDYLQRLNDKMMGENRHIAMILDNFQGHKIEDMSNLQLFFLPPNTTSHSQPFDGGIIKNFRDFFRMQMSADLMDRLPSYKSADEYYKGVTVWEASLWAVKADESVTVKTRVNCFAHCKVATDLAALSVIPEPTTTDQVLQDFSVVFDDEEDPFEMDE